MSETHRARLRVVGAAKSKRAEIDVSMTKGSRVVNVRNVALTQCQRELRTLLEKSIDELSDREVEFEIEGGQVQHLRFAGTPWTGEKAAPGREERHDRDDPLPPSFHHAYNFLPTPPRPASGPLADHPPRPHGRLYPDHWSGRLRVRLTTETPLLLLDPDPVMKSADGHATYAVRERDGRPDPSPTSVKGMLRSAYEAVTNSRYGIFVGHDARLAYRMTTNDGLQMVPARIADDGRRIELYRGTSTIGDDGRPGDGLMYAAWLPTYLRSGSVIYSDGTKPEHREAVHAWVQLVRHESSSDQRTFKMWRVVELARSAEGLSATAPAAQESPAPHRSRYVPLGSQKKITGWVSITHQSIDRKHDERVFFNDGKLATVDLGDDHRRFWRQVVESYRAAHDHEEIWGRNDGQAKPWDFLGPDPGKTAWSRHLHEPAVEALDLGPGKLCYARVRNSAGRLQVVGLYPVMIARELYDLSPLQLLDPSLHPAEKLSCLSPADRVFGWVHPSGRGAYRGNLRIGPVRCEQTSDEAIERFPKGLPLAILGQPRPQQARFYAAQDPSGAPLPNRRPKSAGYAKGQSLRGRKVYPHHAGLPANYWDDPTTDRTQVAKDGYFQEYRRPGGANSDRQSRHPDRRDRAQGPRERDKQNRSVTGWVRRGVAFTFDVHVTNLSTLELGALLWLLDLPAGCFHRMGLGKPLGFGSVRLDILRDQSDLRDGLSWATHYETLGDADRDLEPAEKRLANIREVALARFHEAVPEGAPWLRAFMTSARGYADGLPVRYPRARPDTLASGPVPPNPLGKSYAWFVANDRVQHRSPVHGLSLPTLSPADALPDLPDKSTKRS